jgi:hypothetical protein
MSSNPSTPLAAAPAAAAPSSSGPARALRRRDLQQSSLGFFVGGSDCVRFSDHADPEQCRAPQCGAVCLYAARVDADSLETLGRFVREDEHHLHFCVACALTALQREEVSGTELGDSDATILSVIVGASGMDEVNVEDFTNMVVDPSPRSDVDLHVKSLNAPWTQAKIKDIGLPVFMEWLTDKDGDGNLHGCALLINLIDQLNYQSSQVKAAVTRTITAAKKEYASLHPDDDADGGVAQFVLDSLLKDCGSWVAHLRDSQPHSALTSGQRRDALSLAFAWHDRSRWLADANVDKEDVAAQYTTFINSMPLHLRVPLMLGLSDPSMRSMMDLSGNFFVPASFLEFVYALCNQQSILALPFEHIDDWRRSVIGSGASVKPVDFRVVTSRAGTFSALFTVKTTACKGVRWMSPGQLRAAGIAVGKRSFSNKKSNEAYTSCCKAHVACARAAQLAARAASEAAVDPAEVAADASRAASRLASTDEPAAGAFTTPKRRRRSKAKPTPPPKPPAPPPRSTASISFDALASSSDSGSDSGGADGKESEADEVRPVSLPVLTRAARKAMTRSAKDEADAYKGMLKQAERDRDYVTFNRVALLLSSLIAASAERAAALAAEPPPPPPPAAPIANWAAYVLFERAVPDVLRSAATRAELKDIDFWLKRGGANDINCIRAAVNTVQKRSAAGAPGAGGKSSKSSKSSKSKSAAKAAKPKGSAGAAARKAAAAEKRKQALSKLQSKMHVSESENDVDVSFSGDDDYGSSAYPPNHDHKEWRTDDDDDRDTSDNDTGDDSNDGAAGPPPAPRARRRSRRSDDSDYELQSEWDTDELEDADDGGAADAARKQDAETLVSKLLCMKVQNVGSSWQPNFDILEELAVGQYAKGINDSKGKTLEIDMSASKPQFKEVNHSASRFPYVGSRAMFEHMSGQVTRRCENVMRAVKQAFKGDSLSAAQRTKLKAKHTHYSKMRSAWRKFIAIINRRMARAWNKRHTATDRVNKMRHICNYVNWTLRVYCRRRQFICLAFNTEWFADVCDVAAPVPTAKPLKDHFMLADNNALKAHQDKAPAPPRAPAPRAPPRVPPRSSKPEKQQPKAPPKAPKTTPKKPRFSEVGAPPAFTTVFKNRCYTCGASGHGSNDAECPMAGISKDDMDADMRAQYDAVKLEAKTVRQARTAWAKAH